MSILLPALGALGRIKTDGVETSSCKQTLNVASNVTPTEISIVTSEIDHFCTSTAD